MFIITCKSVVAVVSNTVNIEVTTLDTQRFPIHRAGKQKLAAIPHMKKPLNSPAHNLIAILFVI